MTNREAGKGDKPRPYDSDRYGANFDAIFRNPPSLPTKAEIENMFEEAILKGKEEKKRKEANGTI